MAEKLRGPRFWSQHRGATKAGAVGCERGSPPPAVRVRGYQSPPKIFENSDANPAFW